MVATVVACALAPAGAQSRPAAPPSPFDDPTGKSPEQLQKDLAKLQSTLAGLQEQRADVLERLDAVQAELSDATLRIDAAQKRVAAAQSAVSAARGRARAGVRLLYRMPQAPFTAALTARSINDYLVSRTYLQRVVGRDLEAVHAVEKARADERESRDQLVAAKAELTESLDRKKRWKLIVEGSVEAEQRILDRAQQYLVMLGQAQALGPDGPLQDCPAPAPPDSSRNEAAERRQAAVYNAWPFGPVVAIPPGLEAVGPPSVEVASWYGDCVKGEGTSWGAWYDLNKFTTASLKYPLGTMLVVTFGGRSVLLLDNDHGPYVAGRTLDLSYAAARQLGYVGAGVVTVTAQVVRPAAPK